MPTRHEIIKAAECYKLVDQLVDEFNYIRNSFGPITLYFPSSGNKEAPKILMPKAALYYHYKLLMTALAREMEQAELEIPFSLDNAIKLVNTELANL